MTRTKVDAKNIRCPGPFLFIRKELQQRQIGDLIEVEATDPAFKPDLEMWCEKTGNRLLEFNERAGLYVALIERTA